MNKTDSEIIDFLNNCYSKEKAYIFFNITYKNNSRRNRELQKICDKYNFDINNLTYQSYIRRQKELYYQNPKHCLCCGKVIDFERRLTSNFCNNSCAASYNNKHRNPKTLYTKTKISQSLKNNRKEIQLLDGSFIKVNCALASKLFYEGKISFIVIKEQFPSLITKCVICGKEFVKQIRKDEIHFRNKKTCSEKCLKELQSLKGKETYIKVKNAGRFVGWTTRKINSYAEKYWMSVLDNQNIKYNREYHIGKYFLDFKIEVGKYVLDLEIDGKQHKYKDIKQHDNERDSFLTKQGFIIYRIEWNSVNTQKGKELMNEKINNFLDFYHKLQ